MASSFAIIGGGAMGTACAWLLNQQPGRRVMLWCRRPEHAKELADTRINKDYLPADFRIPKSIEITSDFSGVMDAEVFVLTLPMLHLRTTLSKLKSHWPKRAFVVSVAKGIEQETFRLPSEIAAELIEPAAFVALTGPSHAEEIIAGKPASVVAAASNIEHARKVRDWFGGPMFRVYSKTDIRGAELAGALKNVIAIAAGIGDGLGFGINAKSALVSRGLKELQRMPDRFAIEKTTLEGLAGVGDLVATCCSEHSRNRGFGERIVREGNPLKLLQASNKAVEGAWTSRAVYQYTQGNADLPITTEVYRIIFEGKKPLDAVRDLMQREQKDEDESER